MPTESGEEADRHKMAEHTVRAFTEQLESLTASVAQMGGLAEAQLADAVQAIGRRDTALAEKAVGGDARIDEIQQEIEDRAMKLLASRQPVAVDLRETLAAIRTASELERIGDLAKNIAKRAIVLNREQPIRLTQSLARMGRVALSQLKLVLDAYSDRDADGAQTVWGQDGEIDEIYNSLFRELLTYMMEDPRTIGMCTHLLFVAKNIERAGDHVTNIAEVVYFMVTGGHLALERPKADVTSQTNIPFEGKP
jgi:phosphate transport system protein